MSASMLVDLTTLVHKPPPPSGCFVCRGRFAKMMAKVPTSMAHQMHPVYTIPLKEELADLSRPPDIWLCGICETMTFARDQSHAEKYLSHKAMPPRRGEVVADEDDET